MEATAAKPPDRRFEREPAQETSAPPTASAMSIADPAPLGLAAFALTTFVLSFFNAKIVSASAEPVVLGVALAYGGIAQILAGMWEFRNNNTFGATAFTSYGAFWLSLWALDEFFANSIPKDVLGDALGLYLVSWGVFTTYMWVASLRTTVAVSLVFLLLAVTYALLGIGNWSDTSGLVTAGGWFGIATAAVAWYASFAGVTNSTFGRTILPVRPLQTRRG
jgi:succinate-acetate transporter protein